MIDEFCSSPVIILSLYIYIISCEPCFVSIERLLALFVCIVLVKNYSQTNYSRTKKEREKKEKEREWTIYIVNLQPTIGSRQSNFSLKPPKKKVVYDTKNVRTRETLVIKLLLLEKNGKIALVRTNTLQNGNIYFVFSHRVRNISNINVFCTRFRSINQNGRHKTTQQEYNISH